MKRFAPAIAVLTVYFLVTPITIAAGTDGKEPSGKVSLGPGSGGGGGVIICPPDESHPTETVELVDLAEAEFFEEAALDSQLTQLPWRNQVKLAMNRIAFADPEFHSMLWERLQAVNNQLEAALEKTRLIDLEKKRQTQFAAPSDLSNGRIPALPYDKCYIRGAAQMSDMENLKAKLFVSHYLWAKLPEMHKAGLILHEAIYLTHREIYRNLYRNNAPDSSATRKLVGFLFSKELADNSKTAQEREKFRSSSAYQGFYFGREGDLKLRGFPKKLQSVLKPLAPFSLKGVERPLFLESRTCKGEAFEVKVPATSVTCELKTVAHQYPAKIDARILRPVSQDEGGAHYKYTPHGANLLEDISLICKPNDPLKRYNPGFKLICGRETIANVPGGIISNSSGIPIKNKKDFEKTFLNDFEFER